MTKKKVPHPAEERKGNGKRTSEKRKSWLETKQLRIWLRRDFRQVDLMEQKLHKSELGRLGPAQMQKKQCGWDRIFYESCGWNKVLRVI